MIVIVPLNGEPIEHFEDYNELSEHLTAIENTKLVAKNPNFKEMNWSFTVRSPRRVTGLLHSSQRLV